MCQIGVHLAGMAERLDDDGLNLASYNLRIKKYEEVEFVTMRQVIDLPNKTVRLDQLPNF